VRTAKTRRLYQFKVILRDISPQIWRRIQVCEDYTLHQLHRVLQIAVGWENYHLYEFRIDRAKYREPHPENERKIRDAKKAKLRQVLSGVGTELEYVYDFGDDWYHDLVLESILLPSPDVLYPRCVNGERSGPPEDAGGPWGYQEYLKAMADPDHERHEDMMNWRGPFDPGKFSEDAVNLKLEISFRPARKQGTPNSRIPKREVSTEAEQLFRATPSASRLPKKSRIRIKPGEAIPFQLNDRERKLVVEHTFGEPHDLTAGLSVAPPKGQRSAFLFSLEDLEDLAGFIAAEANHAKDKKLEKELDRLLDRIEATLDAYTDEPIVH